MIVEALKKSGQGIVKELRDSFAQKRVNASGRLSRSLREHTEESKNTVRMYVDALGYVFEVEEGTPPPGKGGSRALVPDIERWINDKRVPLFRGFRDASAMAYVIARKINREGTKRYREGIKTGAISDVINEQKIKAIENSVLIASEGEALEFIDKTIKGRE